MKNSIFLIGMIMLSIIPSSFKNVRHTQLVNCVEGEEGSKKTVRSLFWYYSSWLNEVKTYAIDGNLAVVAKIIMTYTAKKHVFLGMPTLNWNAFYFGLSYDERFHKMIMAYLCEYNLKHKKKYIFEPTFINIDDMFKKDLVADRELRLMDLENSKHLIKESQLFS